MRIAHSIRRRSVATLGVALALAFVYETTVRDSRYAAREGTRVETTDLPQAGAQLQFVATAYCQGETTAAGVVVRTGVAAADPALLPAGTVLRIDTPSPRMNGIWTVMDTGPAVQGRTVDLYMRSCRDAQDFGRRPVRVIVLRLGWNPQHSIPALVSALFRRREMDRHAPASPPSPEAVAPPAPVTVDRSPRDP